MAAQQDRAGALNNRALPPAMTAIYVHIPYCESKCPYCDFASVPLDASVASYLEALFREVASAPPLWASTLYIGGGTPTTLSTGQLNRLLQCLAGRFKISHGAEVTIEANPSTLTRRKIQALVSLGVNRVSLGAQSFVERELAFLKRSHGVQAIMDSFTLLRNEGIRNISLDLIYGIPNQTPESWRHSIESALELEPEHISTYCLTIEQGTPFWKMLKEGVLSKKSDNQEADMYEMARETLLEAGYDHYEISNFALPGGQSVHNRVYWSNEEYLGFGAGAVSWMHGVRSANVSSPGEYIEAMAACGKAVGDSEEIEPRMQALETIIQRLRLSDGIDCRDFEARFGVHPMDVFGEKLDELLNLGLLEWAGEQIKCSVKGWLLANEIALRLLP